MAEEVVALAALVVVALTVGTLVAREAERRAAAERRALEAADARAATDRAVAEALALGLAGEHRSALLRSVSHDLRTPLSTIRAVASDLREGGGAYDAKTRDELLDLVVDEAERLDRLVANLLSLSRVEAGALAADRQVVALEELLDQCVRRHAGLVRDRRSPSTSRSPCRSSTPTGPSSTRPSPTWWPTPSATCQRVRGSGCQPARWTPTGSRCGSPTRVLASLPTSAPRSSNPSDAGRGRRPQASGWRSCAPSSTPTGVASAIEEGPAGGTSVGFTLPVHRG